MDAEIDLNTALTRNARTLPLIERRVEPQGLRWKITVLTPPEMFLRQLKHAEFDVSEMSLSSLMIATSQEPTPWIALPIFTVRRFFHTEILVRTDAGIETPADLRGKRVGVAEYQQTAALWSRGMRSSGSWNGPPSKATAERRPLHRRRGSPCISCHRTRTSGR
jgi:4,5-dihydroxyphthalate decarboxylase